MASFLIRALKVYWLTLGLRYVPGNLPEADGIGFYDIGASGHETEINDFAYAGVTQGCGVRLFCPTQVVTREQMAAFLHRAVNSLDALPRTGETMELAAEHILGLGHDIAVAASTTNGVELSAFTARVTPVWRAVQETSLFAYTSITWYSVEALNDISVDPPIPFPSCTVGLDSTAGTKDEVVELELPLQFIHPIGAPPDLRYTRVDVGFADIYWAWLEGGDFTGGGACATDEIRTQITDVISESVLSSLVTVTELCRGDDTALFAPCPVTP